MSKVSKMFVISKTWHELLKNELSSSELAVFRLAE